jgi:hypothetical protein
MQAKGGSEWNRAISPLVNPQVLAPRAALDPKLVSVSTVRWVEKV